MQYVSRAGQRIAVMSVVKVVLAMELWLVSPVLLCRRLAMLFIRDEVAFGEPVLELTPLATDTAHPLALRSLRFTDSPVVGVCVRLCRGCFHRDSPGSGFAGCQAWVGSYREWHRQNRTTLASPLRFHCNGHFADTRRRFQTTWRLAHVVRQASEIRGGLVHWESGVTSLSARQSPKV
jgi:hypothetical protein